AVAGVSRAAPGGRATARAAAGWRATRSRCPFCSISISVSPNSSSSEVNSRIALSSIAIPRPDACCCLGPSAATASALFLRRADHGGEPADRERIAGDAEAADHGAGHLRDVRVVTEGFARVNIGDVDLDHWYADRDDRIEDRNRGGGVARRVEHDTDRLLARLLDPIDQDAFVVRLAEL